MLTFKGWSINKPKHVIQVYRAEVGNLNPVNDGDRFCIFLYCTADNDSGTQIIPIDPIGTYDQVKAACDRITADLKAGIQPTFAGEQPTYTTI